ncbi:MAG: hypothetical protein A2020_04095 [Lentisphaerae bacterium GWF2_45_14]|nr:MAG: hypothetical protein A2020_04095 [Lentisphaerae bacterium GWF2_45_14]
MGEIRAFCFIYIAFMFIHPSIILGENTGASRNNKLLEIQGIIFGSTDTVSALEKMATLVPSSEIEFRKAFKESMHLPSESNITVILKSDVLIKETVSDSKGKFKFTELPPGRYEISAQMSMSPTNTRGVKRNAIARELIDLKTSRQIKLYLRTDLITIKGKVIDNHGKPVAKAKITAVDAIQDQAYLENHKARTWTTISNPDGSYELIDLPPTNFYHLGGYLQVDKPNALSYINIYVEAEGFVQNKGNILKVPLVTDEQLAPARILLNIYNNVLRNKGKPEAKERECLKFPSSTGNVITRIDIVLHKK